MTTYTQRWRRRRAALGTPRQDTSRGSSTVDRPPNTNTNPSHTISGDSSCRRPLVKSDSCTAECKLRGLVYSAHFVELAHLNRLLDGPRLVGGLADGFDHATERPLP